MRTCIATLLFACMPLSGCGTAPIAPPIGPPAVRLSIALSATDGSAAKPISVTAVARNVGGRTVYHDLGCGCDGIEFGVIGPDGRPVVYTDPCLPMPLCPCGPVALPPGTTLERSLQFAGDVYQRPAANDPGNSCVHEYAGPGDYTVVVRYQFSVDGKFETREQRATFHWSTS